MTGSEARVLLAADRTALAKLAAAEIQQTLRRALAVRSSCYVALSGGSTPRDTYALLASASSGDRIDWHRIHFFWSDERCVPRTDERSNFRMADEALLSRVGVPEASIHAMPAQTDDLAAAAEAYAHEIVSFVEPDDQGVPSFDLLLLGLGADGHTASILPGSALVDEKHRLVAVSDLEREATTRLTFTPPLLQHAACAFVLVVGQDKAEAVHEVLEGAYRPESYPAQLLRSAPSVTWFLDSAAAGRLSMATLR